MVVTTNTLRDFNFGTLEYIRGKSSSGIKKKKKGLPILIVAFPFRPLPKIIVFFFCLAPLNGSFTDGEVIHWYWERNNKYAIAVTGNLWGFDRN